MITNEPLISILIPAYKKDFLEDAIRSVVNQIYLNWECIIVNDASPYDLDSIVSKFTDSRIKYYKNKTNCGAENVVDNWNIALDKANGEFVMCMGDDDMLLPSSLNSYLYLINKYPNLDIYHARSIIIDEKNNIKSVQEARPEYETVFSYIYHNIFAGRRQFIGDYLFRTKPLKQAGGFITLPKGWISDELSSFRAALHKGICNTQDFSFCYRENSQTITSKIDIPTKLYCRRIKVDWIQQIIKDATSDSKIEMFFINSIKDNIYNWESRVMKDEIEKDIRLQGLRRVWFWRKYRINDDDNFKINDSTISRRRDKIFNQVMVEHLLPSKDICKILIKTFFLRIKNHMK